MPVKNTKRRTNDGLEGVITGLTKEEKKALEDAGIGGGTAVEANPQEEATQQLEKIKIDNIAYNIGGGGSGGGENYNVVVQRTAQERAHKFGVALRWDGSSGLKANTAYEVGDQVTIIANTNNYINVASNQIPVPIDTRVSMSTNTKLQFGDVILVLTDRNIRTDLNGDTSSQSYRFDTDAAFKYTVVKAGTTGTDVTLSGTSDVTLTYLVYSLGVSQAAQ